MKLSDTEEKATPFLRPLPVKKPLPWRMALMVLAAVGLLFLLIGLWRGVSKAMRERASMPHRPKPVVVRTIPKPKAKPVAFVPKPKAAAKPPAQDQKIAIGAKKDEQSGIRLGLHANEDCWVKVSIDGKTVFQTVLFRGRMESWTAQDRIDLYLSSAGRYIQTYHTAAAYRLWAARARY